VKACRNCGHGKTWHTPKNDCCWHTPEPDDRKASEWCTCKKYRAPKRKPGAGGGGE
jgi:hypothetical protein